MNARKLARPSGNRGQLISVLKKRGEEKRKEAFLHRENDYRGTSRSMRCNSHANVHRRGQRRVFEIASQPATGRRVKALGINYIRRRDAIVVKFVNYY